MVVGSKTKEVIQVLSRFWSLFTVYIYCRAKGKIVPVVN